MGRPITIYKIYFPVSDKCYIGQTNNFNRRMIEHAKGREDSLVSRAIKKHDTWDIAILHVCQSRNAANTLEVEEIRNFDSISPKGYNLNAGGDGKDPCDETRKRISAVTSGKNNPMYGRKRPDTVERNKAGHGEKHPWHSEFMRDHNPVKREDVRIKLSKARKGNQNARATDAATKSRGK